MRPLLRSLLIIACAAAAPSCKKGGSSSAPAVEPGPVLERIEVTPQNPILPAGASFTLRAVGRYSDGSEKDITAEVRWTSSKLEVARVSNKKTKKGTVSTRTEGRSRIRATLAEEIGATTFTVGPAALVGIAVTPESPAIAAGTSIAFIATGTYSDGAVREVTEEAAWTSSDPAVAAVSSEAGTRGRAASARVGTTTISAAVGSIQGSTGLEVTPAELVSLAITPPSPSLPRGTQRQLTATGTFTDASVQDLTAEVLWSSSAPAVVRVSDEAGSKGLATALEKGPATIFARRNTVEGSTTVTGTDAALASIGVTPPAPSAVVGTRVDFTATGIFTDGTNGDVTAQATWTSTSNAVATVSSAAGSKGQATAVAVGSADIEAALGGVKGAARMTVTPATLLSIAVTPANPSIALGTTQRFTATGRFDNGTEQDLTAVAAWTSSEGAVASISNAAGSRGLATSLGIGSTTIAAAQGEVKGETLLTVTPAVLASLAVTPASPSIALGTTQRFRADGTFTDRTTQDLSETVTWSSSNGAVASISSAAGSRGLATSLSTGSTEVGAALSGVTGSTTLTVTAAAPVSIVVTPENPTIPAGTDQAFRALTTFTDASTQDLTDQVTWGSSDGSVAAISNAAGSKGVATGLGEGDSTITANLAALNGSTRLGVTSAAARYRRCDPNEDRRNDVADGVYIIDWLFRGAGGNFCQKAGDCNDDGRITISDALYCFDYQLRGGAAPQPPFPACGIDPTPDDLPCEGASCR